MINYDGKQNLYSRLGSLDSWGHASNVWNHDLCPPKKGHVVEISSLKYVSKPCWNELLEVADHIDTIVLDFREMINHKTNTNIQGNTFQEIVHQFFFSDFTTAKKIALRVQKSARNKRKDLVRGLRLVEAGGFHNKEVLDQLFEIQRGRCYFSGESLIKEPKNFVADHLLSIYLGGTDWPNNIVLVIKEINTWKGGLTSKDDTLQSLAKKRGKNWLHTQKSYCSEVDLKRKKLDKEFRYSHEIPSKVP